MNAPGNRGRLPRALAARLLVALAAGAVLAVRDRRAIEGRLWLWRAMRALVLFMPDVGGGFVLEPGERASVVGGVTGWGGPDGRPAPPPAPTGRPER